MTMSLLRPGRLRAVLRQAGRAVARTAIAVPWRRAAASRVPPTRFADNGPVCIAYDVRGRGRPLVLVQGVGVGRWDWDPVADRLARRFRVISIDNRGIGASDTPPGPFTTRAMAQDVLAVLDHAGIERASVLGTSLGGMVAQELALTHPERVDRLVLVATLPGGPRSRPMPLGTTYLFAAAPLLTGKARLRQFVNNALGPATRRGRPEIAERLAAAKQASPQSEGAWRAQVAAGMLFTRWAGNATSPSRPWSSRARPTRSWTPATPTCWPTCSRTPGWSCSTEPGTCSTGSTPGGSPAWSPASSPTRRLRLAKRPGPVAGPASGARPAASDA
jgi:pimeloyl-ACP methyl ester carboxylesterase